MPKKGQKVLRGGGGLEGSFCFYCQKDWADLVAHVIAEHPQTYVFAAISDAQWESHGDAGYWPCGNCGQRTQDERSSCVEIAGPHEHGDNGPCTHDICESCARNLRQTLA